MRYTSYDELIWTCQDNQAMPFLMDLNGFLKAKKAKAVLLEEPVLVERDPSRDPDLSVVSDNGAAYFALDYPCSYAPLAGVFTGGEDNAFLKSLWKLSGILATRSYLGLELMPVASGWSDGHMVTWPDVPRLYMRGDGGCLQVSLSYANPMSMLYREMLAKHPEKEKLDALLASGQDLYHMVEEICRWLEGRRLEVVPPKPPKMSQRTATRIKVVRRGHMGYIRVWEPMPKRPTTTTPTSSPIQSGEAPA